MCLPIRLPAHVFFTIMKFHNNEIHNNERTPDQMREVQNKYCTVIWIRKLDAQFSQNRILVIIKHLASYKIGDSLNFANFTIAHVLTGALYGTKAKNSARLKMSIAH